MEQEQATQLSDTRPHLDNPLRVALPVNVPERNLPPSKDIQLRNTAFSPIAQASGLRTGRSLALETNALSSTRISTSYIVPNADNVQQKQATAVPSKQLIEPQNAVKMHHDANLKNVLRDYTLLAHSSRRANKKDIEASAYASLGVVLDNQEDYGAAIEQYTLYLAICEELGDNMGIAAACNCMGVDYMLLANPSALPSAALAAQMAASDSAKTVETRELIQKAIALHSRHAEIGPDAGGKLVANSNLGLCLTWLNDVNAAARHHQDALRLAIKMQTLYGQSIAVGNLGLLALSKNDFGTAKTCFEQHLQLIQALLDPEAEIGAWKLLADLSAAQENYPEALGHLEQARNIAQREGFLNELRRVHCLIGIAKGTMEFTDYTRSLREYNSFENTRSGRGESAQGEEVVLTT